MQKMHNDRTLSRGEEISREMAEIMLRIIARDEAQESDQARYDMLKEKLEVIEFGL